MSAFVNIPAKFLSRKDNSWVKAKVDPLRILFYMTSVRRTGPASLSTRRRDLKTSGKDGFRQLKNGSRNGPWSLGATVFRF